MEVLYTEIRIAGIPILPAGFQEKIYTDTRPIQDGLHIEFMAMTDKFFQSVDNSGTYQRHKIQSRIYDKYSLTLYAKENINIDIVKIAPELTIILQNGDRINGVILDITKEPLSPTYTYKYKITFYNLNKDVFTLNNYLTSEYLLNQTYANDLVKCVCNNGKSFYSTYVELGTSTLPTTTDFDPFYYYSEAGLLYFILPVNSITTTMASIHLNMTCVCSNVVNSKFSTLQVKIWNENYIRVGVTGLTDETGFVAGEVSFAWSIANAIDLVFYTKLLPQIEDSEIKEKKTENTGLDIVNSSVNTSVANTRFYMSRADANLAKSYIPRCDTVYIEYNGERIYNNERVIPDIPKKDDLIDIFEVNINVPHNLKYFYNFE